MTGASEDACCTHTRSSPHRAGTFAKRHGVALAAGIALALTVLGGAVATARQDRVARAEAAKAEKARDFLVSIFASSDPREVRGEKLTARAVLDRGARQVDSAFADQPAGGKMSGLGVVVS